MDEMLKLRGDVARLRATVTALVEERKFSGIARCYAAFLPAVVVLPWIPVYAPVKIDADMYVSYEPIILFSGPLAIVTMLILLGTVGIPILGALRPRMNSLAPPITLMVIAVLGVMLLVNRVGMSHSPDLTAAGTAMIVVLLSLAVISAFHTALLAKDRPKKDTSPPVRKHPN